MSYFANLYPRVKLPLEVGGGAGLRNAQLGAIHAIASHFTLRSDPALVTMPTGSGKTAVLMLTPFFLLSKRVLVITPSVLVRDQIYAEFKTLRVLRDIGAIPGNVRLPSVERLRSRAVEPSSWENLRSADVVVSTPNSISPGIPGVAQIPEDLFDLFLVDEAHHSPARTWTALLDALGEARKVLFTATPFRRDRREIRGRFVYAYPIRRAYEDGIFGRVRYVPVYPEVGINNDVAVAVETERIFRQDQSDGLSHSIMVRTDSKRRAEELSEVYAVNTSLRLGMVHSGQSYKSINRSIQKLRDGDVDGIICVAMLGEGFDFPQLKIAAIHAPHKSLEVTLQFIGRFARTSRSNLGEAKFLAVPNDIELETERLYKEDAAWQEIIANLSAARIEAEEGVREDLATFEAIDTGLPDYEEFSTYALHPFTHVKIYSVGRLVDLGQSFNFPPGFEIVYSSYSEALEAAIFITREVRQPKWTDQEKFQRIEYDLFVIVYHKDSRLLFVNSSRRTLGLYETLADEISQHSHRILPLYKINRVLRDLGPIDCFNVGMRNRVARAKFESYRIIAGSQAQRAIAQTDGRLFNRGHIYARVEDGDDFVTLGYSSGSKVWSNQYMQIPDLVRWCQELAEKILDSAPFATDSEIDRLSVGVMLEELPSKIIAVDWNDFVYKRPLRVRYVAQSGEERRVDLLNCELSVDERRPTPQTLRVILGLPGLLYRLLFSFGEDGFFEKDDSEAQDLTLERAEEDFDLLAFLNNYPLTFYAADFSRICGDELFPAIEVEEPFERNRIEAWNWSGVDIEREFGAALSLVSAGTVHDYLAARLIEGESSVVFYDHGSGEMADFVTIAELGEEISIELYHCKGSGGGRPGSRVGDIYEVVGQVTKSVTWLVPDRIRDQIRHRFQLQSRFLKGDLNVVDRTIARPAKAISYRIVLVQPGLSRGEASRAILELLAGADNFVKAVGPVEMRVIASN